MTAQLVSTECVHWLGNSPCCRRCWCCFCPGCNYELCWFYALIWTTSISSLIGHRTVWTGYSSTGRPCNVLIHPASAELFVYISVNVELSIFLRVHNTPEITLAAHESVCVPSEINHLFMCWILTTFSNPPINQSCRNVDDPPSSATSRNFVTNSALG